MSDIVYDAELRIPGDLIYLRPVRSFMKELAENMGFSREKTNNLELAVDEVLSNAIEHGSDGSSSQVIIRCVSSNDFIKVTISDAGRRRNTDKRWLNAWSDAVKEKVYPGTERGHGLLLVYNLTEEMILEPNSMGGLDVYLVVYKEGKPAKKG